jgi:hypothetical protein
MLKKDYGEEFPIYKNTTDGECVVKNVCEEEYRENLKRELGGKIEARALSAYIENQVDTIKRGKDKETIELQQYLP